MKKSVRKRAKVPRIADPCSIGEALGVFDGRWKGAVIWWLAGQPRRFNELRRLIPDVSPRALTMQLRALERDGLVSRRQYMEIPPRVEYARTPLCDSLIPLLEAVGSWWELQMDAVARARESFDAAIARGGAEKQR
jgi:DNA-binding HxlR family transcriptional regulator